MQESNVKTSFAREAASVGTPVSRLIELSKLKEVTIQMALARNVNTPSDILESLSHSSEKKIRMAVVGNANTPTKIIQKLGKVCKTPGMAVGCETVAT
jgi:hypothetical protein